MNHDYIDIKGARENNLKNIDIRIPRDKFVIMTGVSGSGKTSLAFDTVYAEGQRRYVESLSAMHASSLATVRSRMWIPLRDFPRPFPSIRRRPATIRVPRSERSRKSMTI